MMNCSACNGRLVDSDLHHAVQECAECSALVSSGISRGDVSRFVHLNRWDAASRPDSLRFFDFTILNGDGTVNRVHGWFNDFSKNIVQVG